MFNSKFPVLALTFTGLVLDGAFELVGRSGSHLGTGSLRKAVRA